MEKCRLFALHHADRSEQIHPEQDPANLKKMVSVEASECVMARVQGQHVPVRDSDVIGMFREPQLMRDNEALVKKMKEAYTRFWQSGSNKFLNQ